MGLCLIESAGLTEPTQATSHDSDAFAAFLEHLTWRADHPSPASCVFLPEEREVLELAMRCSRTWTPERLEAAGKLLATLNPETVSEGIMSVAIASMIDRSRHVQLPPHMPLRRLERDLERYAARVGEDLFPPRLEFLRLAFLILFLSSTSSTS